MVLSILYLLSHSTSGSVKDCFAKSPFQALSRDANLSQLLLFPQRWPPSSALLDPTARVACLLVQPIEILPSLASSFSSHLMSMVPHSSSLCSTSLHPASLSSQLAYPSTIQLIHPFSQQVLQSVSQSSQLLPSTLLLQVLLLSQGPCCSDSCSQLEARDHCSPHLISPRNRAHFHYRFNCLLLCPLKHLPGPAMFFPDPPFF